MPPPGEGGTWRLAAAVGLVASLIFAAVSGLRAQEEHTVLGRVVDPAGRPVGEVEARVPGTYLSTLTGADGRFRIELPADAWRLRFRRVGYRTKTVSVRGAPEGTRDTLRVVLEPNPVELKGLTAEGRRERAGAVFGRTVTRRTVWQTPALGEADVFRSLVYLPGVAQPNDLKGRIHLAGGSSDETGYRLDGHPLQEPFHLLGLMSALNVSALESADVLLHRYPVREGGRLSGLIDLRTRRPGEEAASEAVVSVLSSSFTASRPDLPGGLDLLASGRITYLDRVAPAFAEDVPRLGFWDGVVRLGKTWGGGWRAELLGFRTRNQFRGGDIKTLQEEVQESSDPFTWGESLAGLRLERRAGSWRLSLRGSVNRATTRLDERPLDDDVIDSTRDWWSTGVEVTRLSGDWRATAGMSSDHRRHRQAWTAGGLADELFSPNAPAAFSGSDDLSTLALFAEVAHDLGPRLRATFGGRAVEAGGTWHPAPRALLAWDAAEELGVELSAARRLQFDAEIEEPVEGSVVPPRFLLEEPRRIDLLAAAAEWSPDALPLVGTEGRLRLVGFWKR